jgi:hypothetical protein
MAKPEDAISIESGEPVTVRPQAIRFTAAMDIIIRETLNKAGPHLPQYGQSQKLFERVANACKAHTSFAYCTLSAKSVWDRFKKLLSEDEKAEAANHGASGNVEETGQRKNFVAP